MLELLGVFLAELNISGEKRCICKCLTDKHKMNKPYKKYNKDDFFLKKKKEKKKLSFIKQGKKSRKRQTVSDTTPKQ